MGGGADSLAFCLAFSAAGLDLCGAVGRGAGGYRGGLCLNQLIGCVLLKYLPVFIFCYSSRPAFAVLCAPNEYNLLSVTSF